MRRGQTLLRGGLCQAREALYKKREISGHGFLSAARLPRRLFFQRAA
jgi:hypothetical protein